MTTINLDDQIVATSYDSKTNICTYTYQHTDGSRYTVPVHLYDLTRLGTTPVNRDVRRRHLAQRILTHIQTNPPDNHERSA